MGVNVLSALGLSLSGDHSRTTIHCAVMRFDARNGVLGSQQVVLDTDPTRLDGSGSVNLKDETVNIVLQGKPKHFQLVHLRAPITVSGRLAAPLLGVNTKQAITQGVIAAGLALIAPPAAILAFIDPDLAKDVNCADILADARNLGAPVKASAVHKVQAAPPSK
jgi:hypothetical protein